jgi:hypothetical protein
MAIGAIVGTLGSIALYEGVMALLSYLEGDPEADVQLALQRLAAKNERRALSIQAVEQMGQEDIENRFAEFNEIPSRIMTQEAIRGGMGAPNVIRDTSLLDSVEGRLGLRSGQLARLSSPGRMGDMSSIAWNTGRSPEGGMNGQ